MSDEHERRISRLEKSHDETLAAIRDMTEKVGDVAREISLSNSNNVHMATDVRRIEENQKDLGKRVNGLEKNQESFRPYVRLMEQINTRMWVVMIGVIGSAVMIGYRLIGTAQ